MAGVDYAIERGYADPIGWGSAGGRYGGMLTNYTITANRPLQRRDFRCQRREPLCSLRPRSLPAALQIEIGLPWQNRAVWDKLSPFWKVEKIVTPTLWICAKPTGTFR